MIAKEGAENEHDLEEKLVEKKCPIGREMKISSEGQRMSLVSDKGFRFLKTPLS